MVGTSSFGETHRLLGLAQPLGIRLAPLAPSLGTAQPGFDTGVAKPGTPNLICRRYMSNMDLIHCIDAYAYVIK